MTDRGALAGRSVVVTRATEQAGRLRTLLEAEGAMVVEVPLLRIDEPADGGAALAEALRTPDSFDWIVTTSPNGASRVAAALGTRSTSARFAAVGTATAEALGRPVDLVPRRQVAEGLLAEFPAGPGRVLLAQADRARPVLADGLRSLGWDVVAVVAYRTVAAAIDPALRERVAAADAVTFASASAVEAFVSAFGLPDRSIATISIGPITTQAALELGMTIDTTAREHSLDGLVKSLVARLIHLNGPER